MNVSQRGFGSGSHRGPPSCSYFCAVRGDTRIPSFSVSSLAMRPSPQVGLSAAICRINSWICSGNRGRPSGLDCQRQNRGKPLPRQRMSVSGFTYTSASRCWNIRLRSAITHRVESSARRGLTLRSWKSASCLRRKRFSAARAPRDRVARATNRAKSNTAEDNTQEPCPTARKIKGGAMNAQQRTLPHGTGTRFGPGVVPAEDSGA